MKTIHLMCEEEDGTVSAVEITVKGGSPELVNLLSSVIIRHLGAVQENTKG